MHLCQFEIAESQVHATQVPMRLIILRVEPQNGFEFGVPLSICLESKAMGN